MESEQEAVAGDFVYVPPFAPHEETNNSPDTPSHWVVVRNAQEAIVVNLEPFDAEE